MQFISSKLLWVIFVAKLKIILRSTRFLKHLRGERCSAVNYLDRFRVVSKFFLYFLNKEISPECTWRVNVAGTLQEYGLDLTSVVWVGLYLGDMADYSALNAAYVRWFAAPNPPARACVQVITSPHLAEESFTRLGWVDRFLTCSRFNWS